ASRPGRPRPDARAARRAVAAHAPVLAAGGAAAASELRVPRSPGPAPDPEPRALARLLVPEPLRRGGPRGRSLAALPRRRFARAGHGRARVARGRPPGLREFPRDRHGPRREPARGYRWIRQHGPGSEDVF